MGQGDNSYHVILVADDQEDNRDLLNTFLSFRGYVVVEARNGVEAVKGSYARMPRSNHHGSLHAGIGRIQRH